MGITKRSLTVIAALAAVSLVALTGTPAQARVDLFIGAAPPPPMVEPAPPPRPGFVWAPGYWDWRGHRHFWARGHWERVHRAGGVYFPSTWVQTPRGWHFVPGHWDYR